MKSLKANFHVLRVLKKTSPKLRRAIISNCGPQLLTCISETMLNLLQGTLKVPECKNRALSNHKAKLRLLADKKVPLAAKKRVLSQRGGFLLPLLLNAVLPAITGLVFSSRNNK